MKKTFIITALGAMFMASCADEFNQDYAVDRPAKTAEYAYLDDYSPLKEYVDRSKYPNFKLGVGTTVSEYVKQELIFALVNSNFDEVVAGNAMKMSSCVNDKGEMNFGPVSDFVNAATDAGLDVYGHTLAWHSQQPVKWLTSLMADHPVQIDPDAMVEKEVYTHDFTADTEYTMWGQFPEATTTREMDGGLKITTSAPIPNFWELQYMVADGFALEEGKNYVMRVTIQGDPEGSLHYVVGAWGTDVATGVMGFTPEEEVKEISFTSAAAVGGVHVLFQSGDYAGSYTVKKVEIVSKEAAGPATYMADLVDNGDMEGDDAHNFAKKENAGATVFEITDGVGVNGSRGVKIAAAGGQADAWESQFWIVSNEVLNAGDKVHVEFDYRADGGCVGTNVDTQAHFNPGEYQHWQCAGTVSFTSDWQTFNKDVTIDTSMAPEGKGMLSIAFNMSPNATDGNYYIDNVVLQIEKTSAGGGIPQTEEEIRDTLTYAMDKWIAGMMEACEGKVKAWDVVNEAISGGWADSEGVYALQHLSQQQNPEQAAQDNFFWQDYLGDLDYVRTAVALARMYGPDDIKLFINDYNLESDWDQNGKLKSLIAWIKRWEADGYTKIDGIGTQMHLSYYSNPTTQASKQAAITRMFELMAATGKLIRVSELDIEFKDANGNNVNAADMTEDQLHQMADFYKWIVQQYLSIVPAGQQWGICTWTAIDASPSVSWTHNQLYGYWDADYYRTHSYAGLADGLAGK